MRNIQYLGLIVTIHLLLFYIACYCYYCISQPVPKSFSVQENFRCPDIPKNVIEHILTSSKTGGGKGCGCCHFLLLSHELLLPWINPRGLCRLDMCFMKNYRKKSNEFFFNFSIWRQTKARAMLFGVVKSPCSPSFCVQFLSSWLKLYVPPGAMDTFQGGRGAKRKSHIGYFCPLLIGKQCFLRTPLLR